MQQVTIEELTKNTFAVMARVEHGETIEITRHGKPIARAVPVVGGNTIDLVAAGWATPPTLPRQPLPTPVGEVDETNAVSNALTAVREYERW